jgi:hypothetical protein
MVLQGALVSLVPLIPHSRPCPIRLDLAERRPSYCGSVAVPVGVDPASGLESKDRKGLCPQVHEYQGLEVKIQICANIVEKNVIRVSTYSIPFRILNAPGKPINIYSLTFK